MSNDPSLLLSQFDVSSPLSSSEMVPYPTNLQVVAGDLIATNQFGQSTNHGKMKGEQPNSVIGGEVTEYGSVIIEEASGATHEFNNVVYDQRQDFKLQGVGLKDQLVVNTDPWDFMFGVPADLVSASQLVATYSDGTVVQCSSLWSGTYYVSKLLNRTVLNNGDGVVFYGYSYPNPGARWVRYTLPERRWVAGVRLRNLRTDYGISAGYIRTSNDGLNWSTAVTFSLPSVGSGSRDFLFSVVKPVKYIELRVTSEYSRGAALGQFDLLEAVAGETQVVHKKLSFDVNKLSVNEQPDGFYLGLRTAAGGGGIGALVRDVTKYSCFSTMASGLWLNIVADCPRILPLTNCGVNNLNLKKYKRGMILPKGTYVANISTSIQGGGNVSAFLADIRSSTPIHNKVGASMSSTITSSGGHEHQVYFSVFEDTPVALYITTQTTTSQITDVVFDDVRAVAQLELWKVSDDLVRQFTNKRTFKPAAAGEEADFTFIRGVVGNGASPHNQLSGDGLFSLPYGGPLTAVQEFRVATACIYLRVNNDFKLWKYPVGSDAATSGLLRIEKIDGVKTDYTEQSRMTTATADWVPFTEILPPGTYRIGYADTVRSDYQWYVEKCPDGSGRRLELGERTHHIKPMFANEDDNQLVEASGEYNTSYKAYEATAYEAYAIGDGWIAPAGVLVSSNPHWWRIKFKNGPVEVNGYQFVNRASTSHGSPMTFQLQGRNDDADEWVVVHSVVGDGRNEVREIKTYHLAAPVTYSQFRLLITDRTNNISTLYTSIASMRLFYEILPE